MLLLVEIVGITVSVSLCTLVSVAWYLHRQHQKYDHLPGPPRDSFWTGHIPSILKVKANGGILDDYILEIPSFTASMSGLGTLIIIIDCQRSKYYGMVFRLCLMHQVYVVILDPEYIKDVLVTGNHPKSKRLYSKLVNVFGTRFIGQGIESQIDNKHWILQRMQFDEWFKPHYIRQFAPEFNEFADRHVEELERHADGKTEIHTLNMFNKLTMHVLYKVAFNVDMGPLRGENHPFVTKMKTALDGFSAVLANPIVAINPFEWRYRREVRNAIHYIRGHASKQITERGMAKTSGDYVPDDLLENIMKLKEKYPALMTDEVLLDNYFTFLLAGQETSANALSFMLLQLGRNPDCYKKLQKEIDENAGAVSVIALKELEKLPYLDMVMKETLRLYPIAKNTFRETTKDVRFGPHLIPEGTDMLVSFYAASRMEQNVTNPSKFIPERFDSKNPEKFSKYTSTPFSAGPHTCIGKKFAEIEIKIVIAKIMQHLDFELVPGQSTEIMEHTTISAKDGVKCYFRPRRVTSA